MNNYNDFHDQTIILRKKYDNKIDKQNAQRNGKMETLKKNVNKNNQSGSGMNARKLDENNDAAKHNTINSNIKQLIINGRNNKKMTQKQLAAAINEKHSTVMEYENGKAIPNNQILGKLERKLGIKLRGNLNKN